MKNFLCSNKKAKKAFVLGRMFQSGQTFAGKAGAYSWGEPWKVLFSNDLELIIDICFYEIFSTFTKVASPENACASFHFN